MVVIFWIAGVLTALEGVARVSVPVAGTLVVLGVHKLVPPPREVPSGLLLEAVGSSASSEDEKKINSKICFSCNILISMPENKYCTSLNFYSQVI